MTHISVGDEVRFFRSKGLIQIAIVQKVDEHGLLLVRWWSQRSNMWGQTRLRQDQVCVIEFSLVVCVFNLTGFFYMNFR